jgi:hypothetical protein
VEVQEVHFYREAEELSGQEVVGGLSMVVLKEVGEEEVERVVRPTYRT